MLNCLENTLKLQFDSYVWQLSNSWPNQFQNNLNLTWPFKTAGISLDSRLEWSKITHRYVKASPFTWFLCWNFLLIQISSILSVIFIRLWLKCQRVFWWASCTSARHAGSFDCLMTSLILITMDNGRGHCTYWQSCKVPNQTHRGMKKFRKMYAIKQIKICAEYRDMLTRPRLDLSGTPELWPIGLSPGSWQTSLGLGSMSRYSAQILICITFYGTTTRLSIFIICYFALSLAKICVWGMLKNWEIHGWRNKVIPHIL